MRLGKPLPPPLSPTCPSPSPSLSLPPTPSWLAPTAPPVLLPLGRPLNCDLVPWEGPINSEPTWPSTACETPVLSTNNAPNPPRPLERLGRPLRLGAGTAGSSCVSASGSTNKCCKSPPPLMLTLICCLCITFILCLCVTLIHPLPLVPMPKSLCMPQNLIISILSYLLTSSCSLVASCRPCLCICLPM
ncbi:hypothetical protein O6H91_12G052500 [Diphasiastrum complanatum]|uniref:Uncharacterized protein n=1 Tax=Diphasiastrum complanatum TaxID=34168 RepID=A0ACC2C1Z9_DIPCM|nr:hypothetical protein O6H91_12G052500 [Diphasiastrum complanatum]